MERLIPFLLGLCALGYLGCGVALIRNQWVYDSRSEISEAYFHKHSCDPEVNYESYDAMFNEFWNWDIKSMRLPYKISPWCADQIWDKYGTQRSETIFYPDD